MTAEARTGVPPMVLAEGVHKRFGRLEVLRGIDLTVQRGEVMCGKRLKCWKTIPTLIRCSATSDSRSS